MTQEEMQAEIERLKQLIAQKDEVIQKQSVQIENMMQVLLHARKERFGAKSEASIPGQMSLFSDAEQEALAKALEEQKQELAVPDKKPSVAKKSGISRRKLESLPVEVTVCELDPKETCDLCGAPLKKVGQKTVRSEVEYIRAKVIIRQYVQTVYKCTVCGSAESPREQDHFVSAALPKPLLNHCIVSPSMMTEILYEKYFKGVPLNRQENMWRDLGIIITRKDMAHWTNRVCEEWLQPVVDVIHRHMLEECKVIHADETRIQCNHEPGRKAHTDSFMWVLVSGENEPHKMVLFHYTMTRNGDHAKELLDGWHGSLVTDAYAGYEKVEKITHGLCWSHVRRKYIDSIPLDSSGKEIPGSKGAEARKRIDQLFYIEGLLKGLPEKEKLEKRQELSQKVLDAFWSWVESTSALHTTNTKLTEALSYSVNQRTNLETFMHDGKIPISNNRAEQHIRPFATHRRAWLFADTQAGARANATAYSLIETARSYDLNVYEYIHYVLKRIPMLDHQSHPENLEELMPWSKDLPKECYRTNNPEKDEESFDHSENI
ncbi:IS66 family transposase [Agathobacter sp.]|uniref:IS66 family transposase n=1 Tax=Agathobacter sp. TaxID=2021311 RepID=UPI003FD882F1